LCLPFLPTLPIAAALGPPLLLAVQGLTIASPRLPPSPPAGFRLARLTAIARQRLLGPENLPAALQQTPPPARSASRALSALPRRGPLILERICRIFRRAHGRWCSQKLMPRRGILLLSGALLIIAPLALPRTHPSIPSAPPLLYLKTRPWDSPTPTLVSQLTAIQPRQCCPIWPRHNGPILAAANTWRQCIATALLTNVGTPYRASRPGGSWPHRAAGPRPS
jgi:hypothetical protein